MNTHLHDLPAWARDLLNVQALTIDLQSVTLNRIATAMSAQSDATEAAVKALTDEAHVAAEAIKQSRADLAAKDATIADLQGQLASAQGGAENPAQLQTMADTANAATAELQTAINPQPQG